MNLEQTTMPIKTKLCLLAFMCFIAGCLIHYFFSYDINNKLRIWNCREVNNGIYAEELVYNAINLNHQVTDNKNKKDDLIELLHNPVTWYGKRRYRDKLKLSSSKYDCFCLTHVVYDYKDKSINNYEMRVTGLHRYRHPDREGKYVQPESLLVTIKDGKIKSLITRELNQHSGSRHGIINTLHNYGFLLIPLFFFLITCLFLYFPSVFKQIKGLLGK